VSGREILSARSTGRGVARHAASDDTR